MGERHILATGIAVLVLAAVHYLSGRAKETSEEGYTSSFLAGVALSYVFMHVLPELAEYQTALLSILRHPLLAWFKDQVYLFALLGILFYYVVRGIAAKKNDTAESSGFRYDIFASSLHAILAGYFLAHRTALGWPLLLITGAFSAHYWSYDLVLLGRYGARYRRSGAKTLAAVTVAGWMAGQLLPLPQEAVTAIFSFLSGGIIMDSLHEELPQESRGKFAAVCLGAALYTGLILWIYYLVGK